MKSNLKLFGTDGIRAKFGKFPLTSSAVTNIGRAVAIWSQKKKLSNFVALGQDPRYSSATIKKWLTRGLLEEGITIVNLGVVSTPCLAYLTRRLRLDIGIMISASHNPCDDNGIKIFTSGGRKINEENEKIIEETFWELPLKESSLILKEREDDTNEEYQYDANSYWLNIYLEFLKGLYQYKDNSFFKIVIDCANGALWRLAPLLFESLGFEVYSINNKPNGYNINQASGAIHPMALAKAVKELHAHIGFAYDGDGDRVILADERGNILDGDHILAITGIAMAEKKLLNKNTVVATQISNLGLDETLRMEGIEVIRTKVGDKYVLEKMLADNYNLGGEISGHIIFLDDSPAGDGLITSLKILNILAEKKACLSELAEIINKYPQIMINVEVRKKIPWEQINGFEELMERERRNLRNKGRIIVRYSGTQPLARILVEAKEGIAIREIGERIANFLKKKLG